MHLIHEPIWTYTEGSQHPKRVRPSRIRKDTSDGHRVRTFTELTSKVANLGFLNAGWFLLLRGQPSDHHTGRGTVALYPSIYRNLPGKTSRNKQVAQKQRFDELKAKVDALRKGYPSTPQYAKELRRLDHHRELCWAILQHYGIALTPCLDATASVRVAASFALPSPAPVSGHVYVFALPYPTGSITHAVDADITLVRLQAACPPSAKRPHFQEGFLVGSYHVDPNENRANQNVSRRLLAKFHLSDPREFWEHYNGVWEKCAEENPNVVSVKYDDMVEDFKPTMAYIAARLGSDLTQFKDIDRKVGWWK